MPKKPENGAAHDHSYAHGDAHDHDHEEWEEEGEEEDDEFVILSDAEGNEKEFRFLTLLEVDGKQFALLTSAEEEESDDPEAATEVFLFHYEVDEDGGEMFADIEDEALFNKVQAAAEALLAGGEEDEA